MTDQDKRFVEKALGTPDLYPDEFKSFLARYLVGNPTVRFESFQLPAVEARNYVGDTGRPAFSGAWANYNTATHESAGYYKDPLGRVHLLGVVKSGVAGTAIFTLPSGYRPKLKEMFAVITGGPDAIGRIDVGSDGIVTHVSGSTGYVQISGISFRAY